MYIYIIYIYIYLYTYTTSSFRVGPEASKQEHWRRRWQDTGSGTGECSMGSMVMMVDLRWIFTVFRS